MKKFLYSIAGAFLLGFSSCDSLDLSPEDYAAAGNFWQTESQVNTFMNGLHSQIRGDYEYPFNLGELRGGTMLNGTSTIGTSLNASSVVRNDIRTNNTYSNWCGYYSKILQVNHFIDEVENGCEFLSESQKNAYLAKGYGIRAYYYFLLYKTYGGVPMEKDLKVMGGSIDLVSLYMERSSAEEILSFIKSDIAASEQAFAAGNESFDKYYWSKYATAFLKAQVYLWSAKVTTNDYKQAHTATGATDLQVAETALNSIISSGQFSLLENFVDNFEYSKKAQNKEAIFALYYDRTEATHWGANFVYTPSLIVGSFYDPQGEKMTDVLQLNTAGIVRYEWKESFVKSFDETDSRRAATFLEYYQDAELTKFGSSMLKLKGHVADGSRHFDNDIIKMRYADVLLMMAEVQNGLGKDCASYINAVRERAYGENWNDDLKYVDNGDYAANELAILKERDKEFVCEGTRWFDVIRMHDANKKPLVFSTAAAYPEELGGEAAPILKADTEQHKLLWSIDKTVLNADPKLTQTWGYNEAEGIN